MIEGKHIFFTYGKPETDPNPVLNYVDLQIPDGQIVGLFGENGAGKSTLLRLMAGLLVQKDSGCQILLDGKPLPKKGYCPVQMIWQHPETAVDPLMKLGDTLKEGGPVEEGLLEALHIQPAWLERYPTELSGGELQRFCIARALRPGVRYLLCDEVSAMLDLVTQAQIWTFLLDQAEKRNLGLVIVSHNSALMEQLCTRVQTLA